MSTMNLKKRDKLILKHIYEYNITLVEIVHQLFFENLKIGAAESTLRRLREKHGLITREKLYGGRKKYFRLTPKGGEIIGKEVGGEEFKTRGLFARSATQSIIRSCFQAKLSRLRGLTFIFPKTN